MRSVRDLFVTGQVDATYLDAAPIRPVVAESWQRSLATGVDPDLGAARSSAVTRSVDDLRDAHPLALALPVIRRLLVDDAIHSNVMVAVAAADGTLLWVEGDRRTRRKAESMNFIPGADWSERAAGTNAPGLALALDQELQIRSAEHFSRLAQPWSCTAVPVHDPDTGALIGVVDLTGGAQVASTQTLALVRATVAAVENHLALVRLQESARVGEPAGHTQLSVLGHDRARWRITNAAGQPRSVTLTGRHADILVLLSMHPEGLTSDHLAILLDEKDLDVVTVRAEMSRLRRVIGSEWVGSRPYRLLRQVDTDLGAVSDALDAGDVDRALLSYAGTLLPQSVSPAIGRLRNELRASLRAAVFASRSTSLLRRWLETPDGRDDREGWRLLYDRAEVGSTSRTQAHGHLVGLDFDLA
ncbi:MAG: GAF domain-containing protein [Mycobacterium sp.]